VPKAAKVPVSISVAESAVMEIMWRKSPIATEEVVEALAHQRKWREATVKTLVNRLLRKGAIRAARDGRRYLYSPVLTREQWLSDESESLVERLFGGRIAPLVSHFSRHRLLSQKDITELRQIIRDLDDGR
jgi:BlaI family transcriptional regulator, penicillinase repressor